MENNDNNIHYIFCDDVLISSQWVLVQSLISFMIKTHKAMEYVDNDTKDDIDQLNLEALESKIIMKYIDDGNDTDVKELLESSRILFNTVMTKLNIECPKDVTKKILTRENDKIIDLSDLHNIHSDFPIKSKSITSRFCDMLLPMDYLFEKNHELVFDSRLEEIIFKNSVFLDSNEGIDDLKIKQTVYNETSFLDNLLKISKEQEKVFIVVSNQNIINTVKKLRIDNLVITIPSNNKFIRYDDIPHGNRAFADIW